MEWEPAWSGTSEPAAIIVAGRLETEGVATRVNANRLLRHPMHAEEAWYVYVRSLDVERARSILRANGEGANIFSPLDGDALVASNARTLVTVLKFAVPVVLVAGIALGALRLLSGE